MANCSFHPQVGESVGPPRTASLARGRPQSARTCRRTGSSRGETRCPLNRASAERRVLQIPNSKSPIHGWFGPFPKLGGFPSPHKGKGRQKIVSSPLGCFCSPKQPVCTIPRRCSTKAAHVFFRITGSLGKRRVISDHSEPWDPFQKKNTHPIPRTHC